MRIAWIMALAALALLAVAAAFYLVSSASSTVGNSVELYGSNGTAVTVYVEIADTPQEREQGLMYRTSLGKDRGMLFVFDSDYTQSFWMKNTAIPLDMIFVNSRYEIVDINRNATPYSKSIYTSRAACEYVVEVNGGFCKEHGIGIGGHMKIHVTPNAR